MISYQSWPVSFLIDPEKSKAPRPCEEHVNKIRKQDQRNEKTKQKNKII